MSEEVPVDAEGSTRNKNYSAQDHLNHLLKVGHKPDSIVIKNFVEEHRLHQVLREIMNKKS
ncbi:MAG: hypothetical protein ACK481_05490 [Candidatus Melainabacteria bacterium]|jgi:hypothetical protein